jgi:hypothetical protein
MTTVKMKAKLENIMCIDELSKIRALGNFLQYYQSDLIYIMNFQMYKENGILNKYNESSGSFQRFLNEFKVARNVRKSKAQDLLDSTMEWVKDENKQNDVDAFAKNLRCKCITQEKKTMTSLASKILFLNNPWYVLPCDTQNRRALGVKRNNYEDFHNAVEVLKMKTLATDGLLVPFHKYIDIIEDEFKEKIKRIREIRENRLLDKLLWVYGQP